MNNAAKLASLKAFLFDLDGTTYLGAKALPGAAECIRHLRDTGRPCLFLTNNSSADASHYAEKLSRMGIAAEPEDVLTSGEAAARHIRSRTPHRRIYVVGTPSLLDEVRAHGLDAVDDYPEAVLLGFDKTLTYAKLEKAARFLRDKVPYYATNPDKVCPAERGPIPDCGSMAALLYEATGRRPVILGKPNPAMLAAALEKLNAAASTTAMVGDRLYTDMQMAYDAGIASILLLSGETREADLQDAVRQPDWVYPSLRELMDAMAE